MGTAKTPTFLRDATGLVRQFSSLDTFNISCAVTQPSLLSYSFQIALVASAYPGADWVWTMILGLVFIVPMTVVYILLTTVMPRSGGDYVWVSRLLHPALGFMAGWAFWVGLLSIGAFLAYAFATISIPIFLVSLGYGLGAPYLLTLSSALSSTTVTFVVAFVVLILCAGINMLNPRGFSRALLVLFAVSTISVIASLVVLATSSHADFVNSFNGYGGTNVTYEGIIDLAKSAGWSSVPLAWGATLASVPVSVGTYVGQNYAAAVGGEIKNIKRNIAIGMIGATLWCMLVNTAASALAVNVVGYQFTQAAFALGSKWPLAAPPWMGFFVSMLTHNDIVLLVIQIGWLASILWATVGTFMIATRYLFAFSFDRVLPTRLADVSDRFQTPVKAAVLNMVVGVIFLIITVFTTIFGTYLNAVAIYSIVWLLASLVAVVLPYRKREFAQLLPGGNWKVPFVSVVGAISALLMLANFFFAITTPSVGPSTPQAGAVMIGIFIIGLLVYYVSFSYRKRQGIDLNLIYREVPPE